MYGYVVDKHVWIRTEHAETPHQTNRIHTGYQERGGNCQISDLFTKPTKHFEEAYPSGNQTWQAKISHLLGFPIEIIWKFSINGGTPIAGWFISGKTPLKWMIWGYPHETAISMSILCGFSSAIFDRTVTLQDLSGHPRAKRHVDHGIVSS